MAVVGQDEQSDVQVDVDRFVALAAGVLRQEGVADDAELWLTFVDEGRIAALNAEHMGAAGPTDVLAFPIDLDDATGPRVLGDVVICPAVAAAQAPAGVAAELSLLVVHGILHVLGHDHATPEDERAMWAKQSALLEQLAG